MKSVSADMAFFFGDTSILANLTSRHVLMEDLDLLKKQTQTRSASMLQGTRERWKGHQEEAPVWGWTADVGWSSIVTKPAKKTTKKLTNIESLCIFGFSKMMRRSTWKPLSTNNSWLSCTWDVYYGKHIIKFLVHWLRHLAQQLNQIFLGPETCRWPLFRSLSRCVFL